MRRTLIARLQLFSDPGVQCIVEDIEAGKHDGQTHQNDGHTGQHLLDRLLRRRGYCCSLCLWHLRRHLRQALQVQSGVLQAGIINCVGMVLTIICLLLLIASEAVFQSLSQLLLQVLLRKVSQLRCLVRRGLLRRLRLH